MLELKIGKAEDAMGWLEFVSSMTGSLAWPIAAVIIAGIFRKQITNLLQRLNELGWGDAKAKFTKELDKAEATAQELPSPENQQALPAPLPEEEDRFSKLLAISPSAAVLDAWQGVEAQLKRLAIQFNLPSHIHMNPVSWVKEMSKKGELSPKVVTLVNELRMIRNVAAHSEEVSVSDAIRFRDLAFQVGFALSLIEEV
jgi:hypothetical protein